MLQDYRISPYKSLLNTNHKIYGIDNLNNYYDVRLKKARLNELKKSSRKFFLKKDIKNKRQINSLFKKYRFDIVINLVAQAGVRYSTKNPDSYIDSS